MAERRTRDLVATTLVGTLVVPYVAVVAGKEVLLADDLRAMSALALMLGGSALVMLADDQYNGAISWLTTLLSVAATTSGLLALALADTSAAELLLTVFVGLVMTIWAVQLVEHRHLRAVSGGRGVLRSG
ncbi:hypothetical protein [Kribbella voronezhensis]|nr:hypothetical protein [Kribbella voronezhensis]